jgi:DNA-binding MarR family transcriptional regulator
VSPEFAALLDEIDALMFRFARLIGSRHESGEPDALSPPQYMALKALDAAGAMRVSDVASHLGVTNPAASMLLQTLSEEGLVDRSPDPADRRVTLVSVSEQGATRLAGAENTRRRFMERVISRLSQEELGGMIRGLRELADAITDELA